MQEATAIETHRSKYRGQDSVRNYQAAKSGKGKACNIWPQSRTADKSHKREEFMLSSIYEAASMNPSGCVLRLVNRLPVLVEILCVWLANDHAIDSTQILACIFETTINCCAKREHFLQCSVSRGRAMSRDK